MSLVVCVLCILAARLVLLSFLSIHCATIMFLPAERHPKLEPEVACVAVHALRASLEPRLAKTADRIINMGPTQPYA